MKLGTQIRLPDGRVGTVVYKSLIGIGIKWGLHDPDPADFEGTTGNTVSEEKPPNWPWEPDTLLREYVPGLEEFGFPADKCVGEDYEIIREGYWP